MFTKNHYINNISLLLITIVGTIFVWKYSSSFVIALIFLVLFPVIVVTADKLTKKREAGEHKFPSAHIAVFLILFITAVILITRSDSAVEFIISGQSLISAALLISLISLTYHFRSSERINISIIAGSFIFSIVFLFNGTAVFIFFFYVLFNFRSDLLKILIFTILTAALSVLLFFAFPEYTFGIDLLAFIHAFPLWILIMLSLFSIYTGWIIADDQEVYFVSGLFTFIAGALLILYNPAGLSFPRLIDTTTQYLPQLFLSVPFFISALKDHEVDRFLGKVYKV